MKKTVEDYAASLVRIKHAIDGFVIELEKLSTAYTQMGEWYLSSSVSRIADKLKVAGQTFPLIIEVQQNVVKKEKGR